jgi:hypothetical protein
MSRTRFFLLALALVGCNPNDFGGTLDRAPVQLIERPDGFGDNAGRVLLPLSPPADNPKAAARLLFAGTDSASLGVADFDEDGKPSVKVVSDDDLITIGVSAGITSMAWLTSPASGNLVLGMAEHQLVAGDAVPPGRVAFVRMALDGEGKQSFSPTAKSMNGSGTIGGHFGLAVARGQVTQAIDDEVIAVADVGVSVLTASGQELASSTCPGLLATPPDLYRALAVGDFIRGGQQEIAMGMPRAGGTGGVVILQYGTNPATPTAAPGLFCASLLQAPNGGPAVSGFGTSVAAVPDQDGDGLAELLVGAPPDRAYLFFSAQTRPTMVFNKGDSVSEFGQRVALVDIDRDGLPEVGITALQANAGKTLRAGAVYFYKLNGDGVTPAAVLFDSNAEANKEFFGIGLADMEFNGSRVCGKGVPAHVPVVGADKGIFTFYKFVGGAADPRCFAQ